MNSTWIDFIMLFDKIIHTFTQKMYKCKHKHILSWFSSRQSTFQMVENKQTLVVNERMKQNKNGEKKLYWIFVVFPLYCHLLTAKHKHSRMNVCDNPLEIAWQIQWLFHNMQLMFEKKKKKQNEEFCDNNITLQR